MTDPRPCPRCDAPLRADAHYCSACGSGVVAIVRCGGCEQVLAAEDWFCSRCGLKVRTGDPPALAAQQPAAAAPTDELAVEVAPGKGITIDLELLPSEVDSSLHAFVRAQPGFDESIRADETRRVRVTYPAGEVTALLELFDRVELRASKRVWRDGQPQEWGEFFRFAACCRERARSQNRDEYCYFDDANNPNPWGCFQIRMSLDASHEASEWLTLGQFEKDGSFVFDKNRIVAQLDEKSGPFRLCPALDVRRMAWALKAFPMRVNPKLSREWRYIEDYGGKDPHAVTVHRREGDQKVAIRIRGVAPVSSDAALKIAHEIRQALESRRQTTLGGTQPGITDGASEAATGAVSGAPAEPTEA